MKKLLAVILVMTILCSNASAQKGKNEMGIAFDAGFPVGKNFSGYKAGFGGLVKGMLGVGNTTQVTFTSGYTVFSSKSLEFVDAGSDHFHIIPLMIGIRSNVYSKTSRNLSNHFYFEPQLGYAFLGEKYSQGSSSGGGFAFAIDFGYVVNNFEFGARYQGIANSPFDFDGMISLIGVHLGYNFSLQH